MQLTENQEKLKAENKKAVNSLGEYLRTMFGGLKALRELEIVMLRANVIKEVYRD